MVKLVTLYPWPKSPALFRKHYLEMHLPLCREIPGILRSRYAFEPKTIEGSGNWFCIFEAEFADEAALDAALATPEALRAAADVANYSPDLPTSLVCQIETV
ncbi:MAG: EthD family reductase [Mycobacteriales bacterium]